MILDNFIDKNATGALYVMISNSNNFFYLQNFDLNQLKDLFVIWQNGKTVLELTDDKIIPNHEKEDKIKKINYFKEAVLNNQYTDTTFFGMRKDQNSPIVITDGIHRAIGIQKALIVNPDVKNKINLRLILFEGQKIGNLEDYSKSISQ